MIWFVDVARKVKEVLVKEFPFLEDFFTENI